MVSISDFDSEGGSSNLSVTSIIKVTIRRGGEMVYAVVLETILRIGDEGSTPSLCIVL